MSKEYAGISLPLDLLREVDRIVEQGGFGYRSRSEVVTDAVRRRVDELDEKIERRQRRGNLLRPLEDKGLSKD